MRCKACNDELTDYESTWKDYETGEFYDLCGKCWSVSRSAELEVWNQECYNVGFKDNKTTSEEPTE